MVNDTSDTMSYVNLNCLITKTNNHHENTKSSTDVNTRFNEAKRIINEIAQTVSQESSELFYDLSGQDDPKEMMNKDISMFVTENNANQASNNPNSTESTELNESTEFHESTESIEATTSTAPLLIIHSRVDLSEKAFAKDVPKRGAPTKAEKKK
ncbi:hypothetical protein BpHYR1_041611 [Brachionus plicatilis]|uniref:Uncharacterized protein n=1 Tax=Brachionus plicatilis TaxID=10195 RepID=A0A3M7Q6X9_BRAPC|nr:hypothetical protein BpHYR1_041611 [Brachionus plicatilis]